MGRNVGPVGLILKGSTARRSALVTHHHSVLPGRWYGQFMFMALVWNMWLPLADLSVIAIFSHKSVLYSALQHGHSNDVFVWASFEGSFLEDMKLHILRKLFFFFPWHIKLWVSEKRLSWEAADPLHMMDTEHKSRFFFPVIKAHRLKSPKFSVLCRESLNHFLIKSSEINF